MSRCTCFSEDFCWFHMRVSFWPERFRQWEEERLVREALRTPEARQKMLDDMLKAFPLQLVITA